MPIYFRGPVFWKHSVVLVCDQGLLVGLCTQDYKSLCAAFMTCSILVNIQTDMHTHPHTHAHTQTAFYQLI